MFEAVFLRTVRYANLFKADASPEAIEGLSYAALDALVRKLRDSSARLLAFGIKVQQLRLVASNFS